MIQSLEDTAKRSVVRWPQVAGRGTGGVVTQVGSIFRPPRGAGQVQSSLVLPRRMASCVGASLGKWEGEVRIAHGLVTGKSL